MHNKLVLLLFFIFATPLFSQNTTPCGHDNYWHDKVEKNPQLLELQKNIEAHTQSYVKKHRQQAQKAAEVITIPVVVHVVHTANHPATNVSDEKIYSQIEALNRDFRRMNSDTTDTYDDFKPFAADIEIEFCLAKRDPDGYPTTGITRTETTKDRFFVENDDVKSTELGGKDPWPRDEYLNMWVCINLCSTFGGCGILGYGTPPFLSTPTTDGVAIQYNFFGTIPPVNSAYDDGRTGVHEVGHWLNLLHTWGNGQDNSDCTGDDSVDDTPRLNGPTFGCPSRKNSCVDEGTDYPDMTENFMDYSNDRCLNMFTEGQKLRMRATIDPAGFRGKILESMGCVPVEQGMDDVRVTSLTNPTEEDLICSVFEPQFTIENFGTEPLVYFTVNYSLDGEPKSYVWAGLVESLKSATIDLPPLQIINPETSHELIISVEEPNGREDFNVEDNEISTVFQSVAPATKNIDFSESFQTPPGFPFPPIGWTTFNGDNEPNYRFLKNSDVGYGDTESAYMPNFETDQSFVGEVDELISPAINFEGVYDNFHLQFFYAYTSMGEGTISDVLEVLISVDCGETYTSLRQYSGEELITADPINEAFVPMEGQWKEALIDLLPYQGFRNVHLKIRQTRGTGNDLYIDNINLLSGTTSIEGQASQRSISVYAYPNPVREKTIIELNHLPLNQNVQLTISNKAGQLVHQQSFYPNSPQKTIEFPIEALSSGMYIISLQSKQQNSHTKFVVVK